MFHTPMNAETIKASFDVTEQDSLVLNNLFMMGVDSRFSSLIEIVILYQGSPEEILNWLKKLQDFVEKNEKGTTINIDNQLIGVEKSMGQKYIVIYEMNGNGYHNMYPSRLQHSIDAIKKWLKKGNPMWAKNNQIESKKTEPKKLQTSVADELIKLKKLMDEGVLSKEEFEAQKKKLLD